MADRVRGTLPRMSSTTSNHPTDSTPAGVSTDWRRISRRQSGVVSRSQLLRAGRSTKAIRCMMANGELDRTAAGVYVVGGAPLTFRAQLWRAVLATGGVLCGETAAELWGLLDCRAHLVHVLIPHDRRAVAPTGVRVSRWRLTAPPRGMRDGLPVTTERWTTMSLLASAEPREAVRLADRALQRGWIARTDLITRLRRYPSRRGNPQLRRLLDATADGAAAESERRLHRILRDAGVRGWKANHVVWVNGDLIAVVDVAIVGQRIAIEVDGMAYHVDVDSFRRDRRRQNDLVALGWTVLRFTWADLIDRPAYVAATVVGLTAPNRDLGKLLAV